MFGIIDCNNFFVSCERVFNPRLRNVPVVVLSNNDGCVIARSEEAKKMGIGMGMPFFKVKKLLDSGDLYVRSGNHALYSDMSRRVMSVVRSSVPQIEVYSIDECFMTLDGISRVGEFGRGLSARVEQCTGIPVSVGVAPTKTLAKMASKFAKKYTGYKGCCVIDSEEKRLKALTLMPIGDVWGIGRKLRAALQDCEIRTAADFARCKEGWVRRLFALPAVHTWRELNGVSCIPLEAPSVRQSITSSRSFKTPIEDFEQLRSIIVDFAVRCAVKLRKERGVARSVTVYVATDRFRPDIRQYENSATVSLIVPSADGRELSNAAVAGLRKIFRKGYGIKKAGVLLTDIRHGAIQGDLFDSVDREKQSRLLRVVDAIRQHNGMDALRLASQQSCEKMMRHEFQSPCYTTRLSDIIEVK